MKPIAAATPPATPAADADPNAAARAKLRTAAHQLEGIFVRQLFEAMRRATPQEGIGGGLEGGAMFTSMLDDAVADAAAQHMERGIGDALYRQLSRRLASTPDAAGAGHEPAPAASHPLDPAR